MFGVNEAKKLQTEATVAEGVLFLPAFHALLEDLSAGTPTVLSCQASRRTKNSLNEERECQPVCVHECMCVSVCVCVCVCMRVCVCVCVLCLSVSLSFCGVVCGGRR